MHPNDPKNSRAFEPEAPPTFNAQAHVDARIMASLADFLYQSGYLRTTRTSELISYCLKTLHDSLINQGLQPILSTEEAIKTLDRYGFSVRQLTARGGSRLRRRMQLEHVELNPLAQEETGKTHSGSIKDELSAALDKINPIPDKETGND